MQKHGQLPAFRFVKNDSLQYHFFANDMAFSVRLIYRSNMRIHAVWVYENGIQEINKSSQVWTQTGGDYLNIRSDIMEIRDEDGEIIVVCRDKTGGEGFTARVRPIHTLSWKDTFDEDANDEVLHLPNLKGTLEYKGKVFPAHGYCKHVEWRQAPRYTGYRFLHGILDGGECALWSADAVFGYKKYDYFKMIQPDGTIVTADNELSSHKQNTIYAKIGPREIQVEFEELDAWQLPLVGSEIDMVIQQRYGRISYREGLINKSGVAVTEYGFGKFSNTPLP